MADDAMNSHTPELLPRLPVLPPLSGGWALDPSVTYLNHGSFGARANTVLAAQQEWITRFERNPLEWVDRRRPEILATARRRLADFLRTDPNTLGFVVNATDAVNCIIRSREFTSGDELLTVSHVYNAVRLTMRYIAGRSGTTYREIDLPFPITGPEEVVDVVSRAITPNTRLVVIDHITSPTGIILPVERIAAHAAERGIEVLVDGAHAPGMLDLDLDRLAEAGVTFYAGNLHKWVCAPRGAAFLWVRGDRQAGIHPNIISHHFDEGLTQEFDWQGTRDFSAWLCVPDAIDAMAAIGWDRIREHNHTLTNWVHRLLTSRWGVEPASPIDGSMLGSMVTVRLPAGIERWGTSEALRRHLAEAHQIEVPIIEWGGRWWLRASCQIYNRPAEYERLAGIIVELATSEPTASTVPSSS
ncbi:MAG: aminotransferase class V-fold PLP-dependent enzyme [Phycisphaerales bacterium]|nr:aminotransferase class V-fold PLP-dependent enzyme [Phycisphaerales bacterium]